MILELCSTPDLLSALVVLQRWGRLVLAVDTQGDLCDFKNFCGISRFLKSHLEEPGIFILVLILFVVDADSQRDPLRDDGALKMIRMKP